MSQNTTLSSDVMKQALEMAQKVAGDPRRFRVYAHNPLGFIRDVLGYDVLPDDVVAAFRDFQQQKRGPLTGLWKKQVEIIAAVNRSRRVAIRSGHGIGKTFVLACLVLWWLYARQGRVVTTASTWEQVEKVLWSEIRRLWTQAKVPLPGELLQTELRVDVNWDAVGLSTNEPTAFQGRHHPDLLVVVDEAPGVDDAVHEAIGSLATGAKNCIVLIGNPTQASGRFYEAFQRGPWVRIHASCMEHPNVVLGEEIIPGAVTKEWVEEKREEYLAGDPRWESRVMGEFPSLANNQLIAGSWVERAFQRMAEQGVPTQGVHYWALDVARFGQNKTVLARRKGWSVYQMDARQGMDSTVLQGWVVHEFRQAVEAGDAPTYVIVDESGLGGPVVDHLRAAGVPVLGFLSQRRAWDKHSFGNIRSELWWRMRQLLERNRVNLARHPQLLSDLTAQTYTYSGTGKIVATSKEKLQEQGAPSPDFADAVLMTFALDVEELEAELEPTVPDPAKDQRWVPLDQLERQSALPGGLPLGF